MVGAAVLPAALGVLLGVWGAFLVPAGPRVGAGAGVLLSVGVLVAAVGNPVAALLGAWVAASRLGAVLFVAAWLLTVLELSTSRPGGSVVLVGGGVLAVDSTLFLIVGAVAGIAATVLAPAAGGSPGAGAGRLGR